MDACVERLRHGDVSAVGDLVTYALLPRVFPEGVVGRQLYTLLTQLLVREGRRLQLLTRATRAASLPSEHYLPLGAALSGHSDSKASLSSLPSSGSSNSGSSGGSGGSVAAGVASNNNSNKNRNNSGHGEGASNGVCGGNALACAQATTSAASRAAVALPLPSADAFDALRVLAIVGARRGGDGAAVREVLHSMGVSHCRRMSLDAYFACTDRTRLYMTVRFVQLLMRTLPCAAHELLSVVAHVQLLTNGTRTTRPSSLPQQQQQLPPQPPPPHALLTQPAPSSSLSLPQPWPPPSSVSLATLQTRSPPALAMMAATASSSSSAEPMLVSIHSTASNEQARMASTYTYHHSPQQQAQQAQNNGNNRYNSNGSCSREHSTASAATTTTTTQQPQLTSVTTTPLTLAAAAAGASVYINGTLHDAELTLYPGRRYRELPARPQHAPPAQNPLYVAPRKQSSNSRSSGGDGGGGESVQWLRPQLPPPVIAFVCYYGLGCVPVLPRLGDNSATHDVTQPPPQTRNDSTSMTTAASNNSSSSGGAGSSAVQALQLSLPCAAPPQRPYTVRPRTLPATTMTTTSTTTQAMPTASSTNVQATTTTATDATARDRAATAAAARTATTASSPPSSTTTTTTTTATMPQVHSTAATTAQQGDGTPALLRSYLYDGDVYSWGCDCYSALGTTTAAATSRPVSSSTSSTTTTTTTTTTTVSSSSPSPHTPSRSTSIATTTPPHAHAAASTPCVPVTIGTGNDADALTPQLPLSSSLSYEHFALTPSRVRLPATLTTVVHVVCGYSVTYLVSGDGALYGCGRSERGQLGMSAAASREHAHSGVRALQRIALRGDEHVVCVACGGASAVALTREGRLQMWGDNTCGQCLRSEVTACVYGLPEQYKAHAHAAVTEVACGVRFGLVTFANGVLGVWGLPPCGVGGTAAATTATATTQSTTHTRTPTKSSASISNGHRRAPVVCLRKIRALPPPAAAPAADASSSSASSLRDAYAHVFAGPWHAVAVSRCGVVYTWGRGARGRLGHGDTSDEAQPRVVAALRAFVVTAAACGEAHTLLLTHTGAVYACGDDAHGQLGLAAIAATATNASNKRSSNGDGDGGATAAVVDDATMCTTPTLVALPAPALAVACGAWHTCVLLCDGDVLVCGAARTSGVGLGRGTCTRALVHAHPSLCALSLSSGLYHSSVLALRRRTRLTLLGTSRYASELSRIDEARESSNNSKDKDKDKDDVSMRRTVHHANNNNSGSGSTTRSNSNETEADKPPHRSRRGRRSSSNNNNNNNNGGGSSARRRGRGTRGTSLSAVRDVALGEGFAIVLRDDGVAVGIGLCDRGQLGLGDGVQPRSGDEVAVALSAYERVRMPAAALPLQSVCCGPHFVLALDAGGRVYGWGSNTCGVLCTRAPAATTATNGKQQQEHDDDDDGGGEGSCGALGAPSIVYTPTLLRGYDGRCVVQIACGGSFVVALDDGGVVLTHGERAYCGLGHDAGTTTATTATAAVHASPRHSRAARTTTPMPSTTATTQPAATVAAAAVVACVYAPTVVRALPPRVISVAAGRQHAVALTADGGIFAWGCGVLGVDGNTASVVPPPPRESSSSNGAAVVVAVAATAAVVSVPTRVAFAQPVRRLGCGVSNTYVVTSDGDLYVWGDNSAQQCGVAAATAVSAAAVHGSPRHGHSHKAVTTTSSSGDDAAGVVVVPWPTRVAQRVRDVAFTRHCCVVVHDDGRVRVAGALQHRGRAYVLDTFDATPQPPLSWPASDAKPTTTTTTTRATAAADALPMLLAAARRDGDAHAATAPHVQGDSVAADDDDNGSSVVATSTACVRCFAGWDSVVVVEQELARPSCGDVTRAVDKLRSLTRAA